jgi:hypothetical protein
MRKFCWQSNAKLTLLLCALVVVGAPCTQAIAAATCTPTGFTDQGSYPNLTAALINPSNTVSGDVDATGCNIGVYYGPGTHGEVNQANIHGADYYGVVNNGGNVSVTNSYISDIGDSPLDGIQKGVAVYFAYGSNASGNIQGNYIWNYQKGGIVVNGPTAIANIQGNSVIGQGPVNYIAQNGIQAGYGARTTIQQNFVYGNSYTGAGDTASGGIILVGGACYGGNPTTNTIVSQNVGLVNDIGVWFSNLDANCNPIATPTRDTAQNNTLVNNGLNNTTGNITEGYQAGIADQGDQDVIVNNIICGLGYTPPGTAAIAVFAIDVTATNNPIVQNNFDCVGNPRLGDHGFHPGPMKPSWHR